MLLNEQQYHHAFNLLCHPEQKSLFLLEFEQWFEQVFQLKLYDFIYDQTHDNQSRLKLILWNHDDQKKMKNGINFDEAKQRKIREQFLLLCQKHHISTKCPSIISYDTLEDEIRKRILNQVQKEIQNIHRPYIWKIKIIFDQVHVFYKTDEQCEACQQTGISQEINQKILDIVKPLDSFHVFHDNFSCVFTSQQTLNEKYDGKMFNYTR